MYKILMVFILNFSLLYSFDLNSLIKSSKDYVNQGKLILLGESLKTAINNSLDTPTTQVKELIINTDNSIKMVVKLIGEDRDFILNITHFDWSITDDNKFIVFENIKYNGNIKWIEYLLSYYFDITKGYITVKYSDSVKAVLSTLKKDIKPTYDTNYSYSKEFWDKLEVKLTKKWETSNKKDLTAVFSSIFNKEYIKIDRLEIVDEKLYFKAYTNGSKKGLSFYVDDFSWRVTKDKNYIVLSDISIKDCEKDWIIGSLKKRKNIVKFQYSSFIENILISIKTQKRK